MSMPVEQTIDICGLVVLSKPEQMACVQQQMNTIPGLMIHASDEKGRMAVTIETVPQDNGNTPPMPVIENLDTIRDINGVVDVSLAYTHCE